jgi:hypothetical protein
VQFLTLGELSLVADVDGLSFVVGGEQGARVTITPRQVGQLEEFLRKNATRERRIGFRVPFRPLKDEVRAGFHVQLQVRNQWVDVTPVDLSLTGILVQGKGLALPVRSQVGVQFSFNELNCSLTGEVVRRDGHLLALHFTESISGGDLDPPEPLLAIYRKLEMEWLRHRLV